MKKSHLFEWSAWVAAGVVLFMVSQWTDFDFWLQDHIYDATQHAFPLRNHWLLQDVLHDGIKKVVVALWLGLLGLRLFAHKVGLPAVWVRGLNYLLISSVLIAGSIAFLKHHTHIFCPWDLIRYGGDQPFVPLIGSEPATTRTGQCWPAGHVSTALSFLGAYFFLREINRPLARKVLVGIVTLFVVLGAAQTLRGAHFLSHNLWSLWWAWGVAMSVAVFYPPVIPEAENDV